jgi:pimeloyl-ACP methyl ester carboxylesterase
MMKTVTFNNSNNLRIVASFWPAASDAIVIMSHGSGANRHARGLFEQIAVALQLDGYNVLAFDFSGHGESDDAIFNTMHAITDLKAAIDYAHQQGFKRIALFGHSFGALPCLEVASANIKTMVLLGALVGPVDWKWKENYSTEDLGKIFKEGYITSSVNDGSRSIIKTDVHIFEEILAIDQKKLLSKVHCPVLIIHGNADQGEKDLLPFSQKALKLLPHGSELEIIPGAGHLFLDHVAEVIALTRAWCQKFFKI